MALEHTANNSIENWKEAIKEKYKILAKFLSDRQHRDINAMKDTLLYMEYAKAYHFKKVRDVKTPHGDNCLTWVYCYYCHLNLKSHQNVDYTIKNPSAITVSLTLVSTVMEYIKKKNQDLALFFTRCRGFKTYKRNYILWCLFELPA